jgi:hypothetical protein
MPDGRRRRHFIVKAKPFHGVSCATLLFIIIFFLVNRLSRILIRALDHPSIGSEIPEGMFAMGVDGPHACKALFRLEMKNF